MAYHGTRKYSNKPFSCTESRRDAEYRREQTLCQSVCKRKVLQMQPLDEAHEYVDVIQLVHSYRQYQWAISANMSVRPPQNIVILIMCKNIFRNHVSNKHNIWFSNLMHWAVPNHRLRLFVCVALSTVSASLLKHIDVLSGSFLAELLVRSPWNFFSLSINIFFGSKHPNKIIILKPEALVDV